MVPSRRFLGTEVMETQMKIALILAALLPVVGISYAGDNSVLAGGTVVTGATTVATAKNPHPVLIQLDSGRALVASAYLDGTRYMVRGEAYVDGKYTLTKGAVIGDDHIIGVLPTKDGTLPPGAKVFYLPLDTQE